MFVESSAATIASAMFLYSMAMLDVFFSQKQSPENGSSRTRSYVFTVAMIPWLTGAGEKWKRKTQLTWFHVGKQTK